MAPIAEQGDVSRGIRRRGADEPAAGRDGFTAFNECFPGSDEDCRRSTGCKEGGRCVVDKLDPKVCTAPLPAVIDGDKEQAKKKADRAVRERSHRQSVVGQGGGQ